MWLGSYLIGVVLPSETPPYNPNKVVSEPMVKIGSDECMSLYRKSSWQRVPGKRVPLR